VTWILQKIQAPGLPGNLLSWVFGALFPLAFAPFDITPIAWLSVIGFAISIDKLDPKQAAIRAWFYGFGFFLVGVSWVYVSMHDYGYTPAWLAVPMTVAYTGALGLLFMLQGYLYRRFNLNKIVLIGLPALWIIFEWTRTWLLTGFPWLFFGNSQIDTALGGYLPVVGVFGTGFVAVFCCAFWVLVLQKSNFDSPSSINKPLALAALITSITVFSIGLVLKNHSWISIDFEQPINVSLIQGNISQDRKWLPEELPLTKALYKSKTIEEWNNKDWHADLVVWPEAAIPQFRHEALGYIDEMNELALKNNSSLVSGILAINFDAQTTETNTGASIYQFHNSIFATGQGSGTYYKQKLVPFGEFMPLEDLIRGLIPFFDLPMSSLSPGPEKQLPLQIEDTSISTFICYEIVYPEFVRRYAQDTDIMLTISNDAWFGTSHGPHQHFQMARARALENGKFLIRGTNTGLTAIVDPYGKVIAQSPQVEIATLRGTVYKTKGVTPFSTLGTQPLIDLCFVLIIFAWAYARFRNTNAK